MPAQNHHCHMISLSGPKGVRSNYNHTLNCLITFQLADLPCTCYKCL